MCKKISLVLIALILLSTPVYAEYIGEEKLKEARRETYVSKEYYIGNFMFPYPNQPVVNKMQQFIDNFKSDKKATKGKLDDLSKYLSLSGYTYDFGVSRDIMYKNYIENNQLNCYGYVLISSKILMALNIPHKIVSVESQGNDKKTAHTAILVKLSDKWVGYEPTFAMYFNYYKNNGLSTEKAVQRLQDVMVYQDLKEFYSHMNKKGSEYTIYVSPCLKQNLINYNFKVYKQSGKLDMREILK